MLPIDLTGKRAFVAGVADDQGYGWAIVRALVQAGATVCVGTWPPALRIFRRSLERGKLDTELPGGGQIELERIYALDAAFDLDTLRTALTDPLPGTVLDGLDLAANAEDDGIAALLGEEDVRTAVTAAGDAAVALHREALNRHG